MRRLSCFMDGIYFLRAAAAWFPLRPVSPSRQSVSSWKTDVFKDVVVAAFIAERKIGYFHNGHGHASYTKKWLRETAPTAKNAHPTADRQAMTTPRAERYTNFPRKAQQTGRSSPPDRYRANIQQEIRFILSTPLLFFLILPHAPQKATPSSPRGPISFLADSEEEQHNYQNGGRRCNYLLPQCLRFKKNPIQGFP